MHRVALIHIAVVAADQIRLDHLDGVQGQRIGKVAVRGGDVGLDGVGHGVHAGVGDELLGHRVGQLGVNDGDIGRDLKVGNGVLDALLVIGDDREGRDLGGVPEVEEMAQKWALRRSGGMPNTLHISSNVMSGYSYLIHMALAASMGEPPPIATIQSGWNLSMAAAPFMTVSTDGSGSMPSNSSTSMPASFK